MFAKLKALIIKHKRFILYALVGALNTVVDFLMFTLFYRLIGLPEGWSQVIGYISGILCSFLLNSNVTFKDKTVSTGKSALRFIIVNGVSLGVSTLAIELLIGAGLQWIIAKLLITVLVALINYVGYKLVVFKVKD